MSPDRFLAAVIWRAYWTNPDRDIHRDEHLCRVAMALAHYAKGTALCRDYRLLSGEEW